MAYNPLVRRFLAAAGSPAAWKRRAATAAATARRPAGVALLIAAAVVPAALLVRSAAEAHAGNVALWSRAEAFAAECRRLEEQRARLCAEAWALENDPYYIERRVRADWKVIDRGEIVLESGR